MAAAVATVPAQLVGNAFVQQYYQILHNSPGLVHRFYQDVSKLGRPLDDGSMEITTTMQGINEKIVSLNYGEFRAEIKSIHSQDSFNGGVQVLVTGYLTGKENIVRNFAQTFFLAPQDNGYFVLNDIFQYVDNPSVSPALVDDVVVPVASEPVPAPVEENHVSEQSSASADEAVAGEVYNPSENGYVPIVEEEEVPVPEVVDEEPDDSQIAAEFSEKIEESPKKSYASIVKHLQESSATFSPPVAVPRKVAPKKVDHVSSKIVPATNGSVPTAESVNNQEDEAEGYSVYLKGLPMTATDSMLAEVFKKFGTIKKDGIQVRSNRQTGFCFGFVEYEDATSMEKALEASPVTVGGRQVFVEEKRSNSRGTNNRGRFAPGRGPGFRNEVGRGRGIYNGGGSRGHNNSNRDESSGRSEFVNRGSNRSSGNPLNRDGFQKSENVNNNGGGRMNRNNGGVANGNAKMTPRVAATA